MLVINETNYLDTKCVEDYAARYRNRLYASKTGMLQLQTPIGYLTLELLTPTQYDQVEVKATFEHKNMGSLD